MDDLVSSGAAANLIQRSHAADFAGRSLPTPEPSMGAEAYARERELACAMDPRKQANYARYQASARGARLDYLPIKLDIENVSRCNFHCTMCVVSDWAKGQRAEDLSVADFKALIDEQYGLVEIKLQGIGEPTLQRDSLYEMIAYARARHIWVRTTTNASLLHLNDNYKKLIDCDTNEVQISIDGADRETFEKIRRGGKFKRVTANCKLINKYQEERGVCRTKMWTVVQRDNIDQLEALVDLAAALGFKSYVMAFNVNDWGIDRWKALKARLSARDLIGLARMFALVDRGAALGLKVQFWDTLDAYSAKSPQTLCAWPFERAYYSSDKRIVPCCFIANPDTYEFAGAKDGLTKVWNGEEYAAFRQAHLDGKIPDVCKACYGE